ncbi:MAG: hypothetical protein WDN45_02025 [Caulobacteraceae bacterium]
MKPTPVLSPILLCALAFSGLAACGRREGLFADRTVSVVAPVASAGEAPRFVGRWTASMGPCENPWLIEARSLKTAGSDCDFDKVSSDSAGYTVVAVCRSGARMTPVRLSIVTPDQARISTLTISGGPFRDAVPLQRCSAP